MYITATVITTAVLLATPVASRQEELVINTPLPMAQPAFLYCEQFEKAQWGDTCDDLTSRANNMDRREFYRLNPSVGGNKGCAEGQVWAGEWYCFKAKAGHGPPSNDDGEDPPPPPERTTRPDSLPISEWDSTISLIPVPTTTTTATTDVPKPPGTCVPDSCNATFEHLDSVLDIQAQWQASVTCTQIFNTHCVFSQLTLPRTIRGGRGGVIR
jgi:hypothetical protein